jgi:TolA-binding protein
MFCVAAAITSCKSPRDKMIAKIEATDKMVMADTLLRNDSLASQQFNNLSAFALKFPRDEKTPEYLLKSADLANRLKRTTQAFMIYKEVNDSFPDTKAGADAMFMMAFQYENNFKNYPKAKEYYAAFIAKYPTHPLVKDAQASLDMLNSGKTVEEMVKEWEAKADSSKK